MPDHILLPDSETISISSIKYFSALNDLLQKTPKRTIVNFIMWKFVDYYSQILTGKDRNYINGTALGSRTSRCVKHALIELPISTNALYVEEFADPEIKSYVTEMITEIKNEFKKLILANQWMDKETKKYALRKVHHMTPMIAYPTELRDMEVLAKYHENITVDETNFFKTTLALKIFQCFQIFKNIHQLKDKNGWEENFYVTDINAYYNLFNNNLSN
jgi:membrane metallo-endopeptidase-like protein 1